MRASILLILCVLMGTVAFAQKKQLIENTDEVIETAIAEIDRSLQNGDFKKFVDKNGITGTYIFDITIHKKGEVASVFAAASDGTDIPMQNKLKDFIKAYTFSFKMPKGKRYKFQYIFEFS